MIQKSNRENSNRVMTVQMTFNVDKNFYARVRKYADEHGLDLSKALRALVTKGLNDGRG